MFGAAVIFTGIYFSVSRESRRRPVAAPAAR